MPMCSQRNIAARSELGERHPKGLSIRHSIANFARSLLGVEFCNTSQNRQAARACDSGQVARPRRRGDRMSNCDFMAAKSLTDLTRPNQSVQRLPRGRHAVPTAMTVGPKHVIANDRVERGDHLAHHCHDRDFRLLSGSVESIMERLEGRIPIAGAHRRHVEHLAYIRTTTPDAPPALERAALERV